MSPAGHRQLEKAMPWIVIIGALLVWQAGVRILSIQQFILPAPTDIYAALIQ
jgi:NitT/TauT family transport system permease protein